MLKQLIYLLNGIIQEKELIMTATLFNILRKIKNPITDVIIDAHNGKKDVDNSYWDISKDSGMVSFLPANKEAGLSDNEKWTKSRTPIKLGRLLRGVLMKFGEEFTNNQIEDFVNQFKILQSNAFDDDIDEDEEIFKNIKTVSGTEITHWYHRGHYAGCGFSLCSCMSSEENQTFFRVYEENAKMVILLDERGKLLARAILWEDLTVDYSDEVIPDDITFMDRIYFFDRDAMEIMIKYATKQGWWYKQYQDSSADTNITNGDIITSVNMSIDLDWDYSGVNKPYMDTLKYLNHTILSNSSSYYDEMWQDQEGGPNGEDSSCSDCNGDGEVECDECNGEGFYIPNITKLNDSETKELFDDYVENHTDKIIELIIKFGYEDECIELFKRRGLHISTLKDFKDMDYRMMDTLRLFIDYSYPFRSEFNSHIHVVSYDFWGNKVLSHDADYFKKECTCEDGKVECEDCNGTGRI